MYQILVLDNSGNLFNSLTADQKGYTYHHISENDNIKDFQVDLAIISFSGYSEKKIEEICDSLITRKTPLIFLVESSDLSRKNINKFKPISVFTSTDPCQVIYAIRRVFRPDLSEKKEELLKDSITDGLFLKKDSKYIRLRYEDLLYLEADGNYVVVQMKDQKYVVRISLRKSSGALRAHSFIQIHRNYIVNFHLIKEVDIEHNQIIIGEHILPIGRAYKSKLKDSLPALH